MSQVFGLPADPAYPSIHYGAGRAPVSWEDDPRSFDGHAHAWEEVLTGLVDGRRWVEDLDPKPLGGVDVVERLELVELCGKCRAPRCDRRNETEEGDRERCLAIRHHREPHAFPDGTTIPVGADAPAPEDLGNVQLSRDVYGIALALLRRDTVGHAAIRRAYDGHEDQLIGGLVGLIEVLLQDLADVHPELQGMTAEEALQKAALGMAGFGGV